MKRSDLWKAGLFHYWRAHLAVACAAAVATAVLTGALLVGDSMRGSLRDLTLSRLGDVDYALSGELFFGEVVADRIEESEFVQSAAPAIIARGSASSSDGDSFARKVNILGVDHRFWQMYPKNAAPKPDGFNIAINRRLADELRAKEGDDLLVRLEKPSDIPRESTLGEKTDTVQSIRLTVDTILPDKGVGRFSLQPSQHLPLNLYVDLAELQRRLNRPGRANTVLLAQEIGNDLAGEDSGQRIAGDCMAAMSLDDLGLSFRISPDSKSIIFETRRMIVSEATAEGVLAACASIIAPATQTYSYLANRMASGGKETPYSMVCALEQGEGSPFASMRLSHGASVPALTQDQLLLNKWAADDLAVTPGDSIEMEYYIDGPLGELQTQTSVLTLAGIVEMSGAALDKSLTPEYPGIQGAGNIADWDPPFPIDLDKIRPKDEDYWDDYGAAPKGFVSLETGQKLWQSRYGKLTSIRIGAAPGKSLAETEREIRAHIRATLSPTELGIRFLPVKSLGLEASSGATDFGALFGGLSFFLIISAAMLISLLFRLAIEQRSKEIGLLLAVGFTRKAINRLFLFQGAVLSFLGGVAGLALGAAYAALMIKGLQTWWIGAVSAVFLNLHVSGISLAIGLLSGVLISSVTIRLSLRALSRVAPSALLAGQSMPSGGPEKSRTGIKLRTASGALLLISGIGAICFGFASEDSPVGVFFTGGACLFISFLCFAAAALAREFSGAIRPGLALALTRLGIANAARNAGRSLLILTLVASASFLLVAVGANRHADTGPHSGPRPGTLGFSIVAESDIPLFYDLNSESGRRKLNLPTESTIDWSETRIYSLRLRPGEDVSCLNLYKPETPRIIGAPPPLIARGVGEFQSSLAETEAEQANPWRVLDKSFDDGAIPAIGDANTVMWILHSGLGKDIEIQDDRGETIRLRIAGLLSRSMLQSELVISEDNFTGLFPSQAGYRFFLAETSADATASTSEWMEKNLSDFGFDATSASERLSDYLAVEDTYISAFQSLGGLGLLLGVLGLSAVVMRNIFERRAELSLLWALGFKPRQIRWIIIAENAALLIAGLAIGTISALAALLPARRGDIASLPWASLSLTLGLILLAGIAASAIVAMLSMKSPSAASLRADT